MLLSVLQELLHLGQGFVEGVRLACCQATGHKDAEIGVQNVARFGYAELGEQGNGHFNG
jgi:hypothetical protein